jgi:transcription initiation factor TFIID TATA-box-binding protein
LETRIVNVVSTADLKQSVDLAKLNKQRWGIYDLDIYPAGYIKDGDIQGKVIIFHSGKLISTGSNTIRASFHDLTHAKTLLLSVGMIEDVKLNPLVRNIVSTTSLNHKVDLFRLVREIPNVLYEPEQFPGLIYRPKSGSISILIFASGKAVIAGAKSEGEVSAANRRLQEMTLVDLNQST